MSNLSDRITVIRLADVPPESLTKVSEKEIRAFIEFLSSWSPSK